ncbi:hypothetical protein [Kangiella marina]|uniref:Uncharacterized protein n=1 Tax=Kangiella marina TaxID=1079178 RepID=A0ABP8IN48_9GAMM
MKQSLLIATFTVSCLLLISFFSIDACMDAGGLWSNLGLTCEGAYSDFIPQYERTAPAFWVIVLSLSGLATFLVGKVIKSKRNK